MKKKSLLLCGVIAMLSCAAQPEAPLWNLDWGTYDVGFKTLFRYDRGRVSVPFTDWDGNVYPTKETAGRQMQINIWYPAEVESGDQQVRVEDYLHLLGQLTEFSALDAEKKAFAKAQYIARTRALSDAEAFSEDQLEKLRQLPANAYHAAKPIDSQFPLVIYPGDAINQSITCELLASHGFVVVGVSLKGEYGSTMEATLRGLEMAVDDLEFVLHEVLQEPQVDGDRIALMANAIASSVCVALQSRNARIHAVISLEGGLISAFEQRILRQTPFYTPENVQVPILAIYAPHPNIKPEEIFHLKYADRYFVHFPRMTEYHFLNYGIFEQAVPNIIGAPKGDVHLGFKLAMHYCLTFLRATLENKPRPFDELLAQANTEVDTVFTKEGLPAPPTLQALKDGFVEAGFSYIEDQYTASQAVNPQPYSMAVIRDLASWLAWKKDPEYTYRVKLFQMATESYPTSAYAHYALANYLALQDKTEEAKAFFEQTLTLLETDEDAYLSWSRRKTMQENATRYLSAHD